MYSLRLLGGISLDGPSGPLSGPVVQPRQSAVLAVLGAARDRGTSREKVVGLLWPESDQAEARHTLANSVYELRQALGEEAVLVSGDNLRLNSDIVWTDVAAFGEALERGDLAGATEAYSGPFLDGFYLSGAEEFERWVESERQRLAVQYAEALESLAESSEDAGDFPRAVGWWQRLAAYDPYNSRFAVRLMQAMAAAGDPANALQYAQEHEDLLRRELDIDPPEDVLALAERLRRERVPSEPTFEGEPVGVQTTPEGAKGAAEPTSSASPANRRSRMVLVAAAAAIAIAAAAFIFLPERGVTLDERRVVVAVFENRTGDPSLDPLGVMSADWITEGLSRTGLMEVVPSTVALLSSRAIAERAAAEEGLDQVRVLAEETGAGTVVWGAYYRVGEGLGFQTQITDVADGKLLTALEPVIASTSNPLQAVEEIRQRVMGALASVHNPRVAGSFAIESAPPPKFESYQEYAAGLELFMVRQFGEAADRFARAAKIDSTFAAAQLFLSAAYYFRGQLSKADSITRLLSRSREQLNPADREVLDYVIASLEGDWPAAVRAAQRRIELAPDPLWTYSLGVATQWVNRPRESADILKGLDPAGPALRGWTDYWRWLTTPYHMLGDHSRELEEARRARRQYPNRLPTLSYEVRALAALGRLEELNERLDECLALPAQGGWTPGRVMWAAGTELRAHGYHEDATEVSNRAIDWYRSRAQEQAETATYRYGLAQILYEAERWQEARTLIQELVEEFPGSVIYLGYLGVLNARLGNTQQALRIDEELRTLNPPYSFGWPSYWRARIAAVRGERDRAVDLLNDAIAKGHFYTGRLYHTDKDLESLRGHAALEQLLQPKG
jgi:DNA-binding SARP family transcriptional activator